MTFWGKVGLHGGDIGEWCGDVRLCCELPIE